MAFPDLQGCRVLLRMNEGSVEGVVVDVSQKTSRITLDQVIGTPDDLPKLRCPIATDFEVIDEVNDQLSEAVAASSKVYVFDVQKMKKELFDHGLKEVFESDDIEKVADVIIYLDKKLEAGDCHLPSYVRGVQNCLRRFPQPLVRSAKVHTLKTGQSGAEASRKRAAAVQESLRAVSATERKMSLKDQGDESDIETEDEDEFFLVQRAALNGLLGSALCPQCKEPGLKMKHGTKHGLAVKMVLTCTACGADAKNAWSPPRMESSKSFEDEVCAWGQRPLSLRQIDALVKDVVYLGELARVCLKQMLQKFHLGVEFFLGLDRDCSEEELRCLPLDHILPMGFRDALKLGAKRAAPNRNYSSYDEDCYREYGPHSRRVTEPDTAQKSNGGECNMQSAKPADLCKKKSLPPQLSTAL
ncbi:hypothetical protein HPB52_007633 [Rhipicephalus sanguineus]|uniref:Uncharacterized protein n=1 Tax=Rhipicephalus sanguineus TaxID=34632 RepID=A0A9D4T386_RHISA|nr:hypothetical protein HPB52_007633 [Rhipicephalus sanguineus]